MQQNTRPFVLLVEVLLLLLLLRAAAHNISTEAERGITFAFLVAALLLLFTHREGCAERNKIGFCFVLDTSCLLYTSPSPRDRQKSRMPSSA